VRGIARRLHRDRAAVHSCRQKAFGLKVIEHSIEECGITGVKAQGTHRSWKAAALAR